MKISPGGGAFCETQAVAGSAMGFWCTRGVRSQTRVASTLFLCFRECLVLLYYLFMFIIDYFIFFQCVNSDLADGMTGI